MLLPSASLCTLTELLTGFSKSETPLLENGDSTLSQRAAVKTVRPTI